MGSISLQIPVIGQPASTEDPKVASNFGVIQTAINGGLDTTNLSSTANIAQSQINVSTVGTTLATPTRTIATPYIPNATRPTMVYVTVSTNTSATADISIAAPGGSPSAALLFATPSGVTGRISFTFLCPAAWSYTIVQAAGVVTVLNVVEQTL